LSVISLTCGWLPIFIDFLFVLILESHINLLVYILIMWIPIPITIIFAQYVTAELLIPKKKWYIVIMLICLAFCFYLMLFLNPYGSVVIIGPPIKAFYHKGGLNPSSLTGLLGLIFILFSLFFGGLGFLIKSIKAKGDLKRKFLYLALAMISSGIFGLLDSFTESFTLVLVRFCFISSTWFGYFGLKTRKPKEIKKKMPTDKEVELVSFMLGKSEDIDLSKEIAKICEDFDEEILVFVSYATKDAETFKIKQIAEKLTSYPEIKDVLYWQEDLDDNIFEYMNDNLGKCNAMVLFCSKAALKSVPVKKEWTAADAMGIPIIPIFINPDHIPPLLKSRLGFEYDFYDSQKNVDMLRYLILKKCSTK
ncbi:MAG: toll/interleukin-1 receptor domain-containing protein, partial [Promethearchaeota archaeon]